MSTIVICHNTCGANDKPYQFPFVVSLSRLLFPNRQSIFQWEVFTESSLIVSLRYLFLSCYLCVVFSIFPNEKIVGGFDWICVLKQCLLWQRNANAAIAWRRSRVDAAQVDVTHASVQLMVDLPARLRRPPTWCRHLPFMIIIIAIIIYCLSGRWWYENIRK